MSRAPTYSLLDEIAADPYKPLELTKRQHIKAITLQALRALETADQPSTDDWRVCSDAVNMVETLIDMGQCQDASGLLTDAVEALAKSGMRAMQGSAIRLDGPGMQALRAIVADYIELIDLLSARTMIGAHRRTEKRIRQILAGKKKPKDIEIVRV